MSATANRLLRVLICLLLHASITVAPIPSQLALPPPAAPTTSPVLGINSHLATRLHDRNAIPTHVADIAATGFRWVREDFHWYRIQRTPTAHTWDYTDSMVAAYRSQGITILGVLGHPPGWATPTTTDDPYQNSFAAPDPNRFAAWAAETVARYRADVHVWQIWNEPDNPHFWHPAPDPAAYAALVHATVSAIARVAPEVTIVAAGVNAFDTSFLHAAAALGLWNDVDIIAMHPYVNPQSPAEAQLDAALPALTPLMQRYGKKPVWVTEIGWGSATSDRDPPGSMTPERQAAALSSAVPILWRSGVSHVFWYSWKDERTNPYGLIAWGTGPDDRTQPKPARTAAHQLLRQPLPDFPDPVVTTILDFEAANDVWVRGDEHTGVLFPTQHRASQGIGSVAIRYAFPPHSNQYLVFRRWHHQPLPSDARTVCVQVWGDNSSTQLKLWLRSADLTRFQLPLGIVGAPGWHALCAPLPTTIAPWNRIDNAARVVTPPLTFEAIVLDDFPDGSGADGTIWLDTLSTMPAVSH